MTRETEHHGWTIPTEGETRDWDVVLNEFFENGLDMDVVLTDNLSDRPPAGEDSPHLFFSTDTGTFYFNDGDTWIDIIGTTYTDADAIAAINQDADHGSTAPHNYYTDSDARSAVANTTDFTFNDDLFIDDSSGSGPSFNYQWQGNNKMQTFYDVDNDEYVWYHYSFGGRMIEARGNGEYDIRADEMQFNGSTLSQGVDTSGQVTLSSGSATVTTSVSSGTTATFYVAIGPVTDDAEVEWSIRAVSGGNYQVHFHETNTTVGNPTVDFDVIRVR